jgi:hypothetical protein
MAPKSLRNAKSAKICQLGSENHVTHTVTLCNTMDYDTSVTPKVFKFIEPSNDGRWHGKGLSTRVQIAIRIAVRFRAKFLRKQNRDPIIYLASITMVRFHI